MKKGPFQQLFGLISAILPVLLMLIGGLGVIYCMVMGAKGSFFMGFSLLMLLIGITYYTYNQAMKSKIFKERLGIKDKKKKKTHKKMGKRCPQCGKLIYHRRTICQHCSYEFPSHKKDQEDEEEMENEEVSG